MARKRGGCQKNKAAQKTRWGTAEIRCPFFKKHEPKAISCEGITEDCVLRLVFTSQEGRERQESIFCSSAYEKCEIYRAIMEKYEEG